MQSCARATASIEPCRAYADEPCAFPVRSGVLVLDLDHTCMYGTESGSRVARAPDHTWNGIHMYKRPHLHAMLCAARDLGFDVYVFTAATAAYARTVVSELFPPGFIVQRIFSRDDCDEITRFGACTDDPPCGVRPCTSACRIPARLVTIESVKDMRKVLARSGGPMSRLLLLDDREASAFLQPANHVRVAEFRGSADDGVLASVVELLWYFAAHPRASAAQCIAQYTLPANASVIDPFVEIKVHV